MRMPKGRNIYAFCDSIVVPEWAEVKKAVTSEESAVEKVTSGDNNKASENESSTRSSCYVCSHQGVPSRWFVKSKNFRDFRQSFMLFSFIFSFQSCKNLMLYFSLNVFIFPIFRLLTTPSPSFTPPGEGWRLKNYNFCAFSNKILSLHLPSPTQFHLAQYQN